MLTALTAEELAEFGAEHGGNSELVGRDGMIEDGSSFADYLESDEAFARSTS
jgi:hypothetical protein